MSSYYDFKKELEETASGKSYWTWEKWHNECLERMELTLKQGTVIDYSEGFKKWLSPEWCAMEIINMTKKDVFNLIFNYIPGHAHFTQNIQRKVLQRTKRIFELAVEEGILGRNPAMGISIKRPATEKKVLNSNEVNLLLKSAKDGGHSFYYHWAVALFTGMRTGEMYALRWTNIDLETGFIHVTRQWTSKDGLHETKSNRNRVVPISPEFKKLLIELKQIGGFKENLWPGSNNLKNPTCKADKSLCFDDLVLPRNTIWRHGEQAKVLRVFCENIGIETVKFHDLRATFITNMLSQGVPLVKVMAIVGHSEMST